MMWMPVLENMWVLRTIDEESLTSAVTNNLITESQKTEIMQTERVAADA